MALLRDRVLIFFFQVRLSELNVYIIYQTHWNMSSFIERTF